MISLTGDIIDDATPEQLARLGQLRATFGPPLRDDYQIRYFFKIGFPPLTPIDEGGYENYLKEIEKYKQKGEWGQWLTAGADARGAALDERRIGNYTVIGYFDKVKEETVRIALNALTVSLDDAVKEHKAKKNV